LFKFLFLEFPLFQGGVGELGPAGDSGEMGSPVNNQNARRGEWREGREFA